MFKPLNTSSLMKDGPQKTLLYGHHGAGKTTQARYYKRRYGKGFIISGEAGLRSVMDEDIDYLPFDSFDGTTDPVAGKFSLISLMNYVESPDFAAEGYKWVMLDSLTEVSDRLIEFLEPKFAGSKNALAMWGDYGRLMIGTVKRFRDLPYHSLVTALAKEESDDNGGTDYWPNIKGGATKQLPGMFDNVFCLIRATSGDRINPKVERYIVTDEVRGWHGKARDPRRRLKPVEKCEDITELFLRMEMEESEFEKYRNAMAQAEKIMEQSK
jgi:hypothetical protein